MRLPFCGMGGWGIGGRVDVLVMHEKRRSSADADKVRHYLARHGTTTHIKLSGA